MTNDHSVYFFVLLSDTAVSNFNYWHQFDVGNSVVCLCVCLSVRFVHCAQTAEEIDKISFAYGSPSPMSLLDHDKIWLTSVNPFPPQISPLPLLVHLSIGRHSMAYIAAAC